MSPERRQNLALLRGISFGDREDFQTWVFGAAAFCLLAISGYSLFQVAAGTSIQPPAAEVAPMPERTLATGSRNAAALAARLPDFSQIANPSERKAAFFEAMRPYVEDANRRVLEDRAAALRLKLSFESAGGLGASERAELRALLERYALPTDGEPSARLFERLLRRADVVPPSLALAQAALESGWGMSRFARLGNNLFGMWCYDAGCGIVPSRRDAGARHEVAAYRTPAESFAAYIRNLNTNGAYSDLRQIRAQLRAAGARLSGLDLAPGLTRYSQEGWDYVGKVQSLIHSSGLE